MTRGEREGAEPLDWLGISGVAGGEEWSGSDSSTLSEDSSKPISISLLASRSRKQ